MEKNPRICKICNRRFANGKAMGGHMRSHLAKLPLPPKPSYTSCPKSPPSPSSSFSSFNYASIENPMQSYRSVNHELPFVPKLNLAAAATTVTIASPHDGDGESETDSPKNNPTKRRSKRRRKSIEKLADESPESVSSISEIFNEEDVAMCLLMLSRDMRMSRRKNEASMYDEYIEKIEVGADQDEDDEDESFGEIQVRSKPQGRYKCETCNKWFRSYQALGGHKASHKKIKNHSREEKNAEDGGSGDGGGSNSGVVAAAAAIEHRIFKCPLCDKVFDSGQALGGHKKVHFSYLGNGSAKGNANNSKISVKSSDNLLDLNLPAPEDDGEVSQSEFSTTKAYLLRNY